MIKPFTGVGFTGWGTEKTVKIKQFSLKTQLTEFPDDLPSFVNGHKGQLRHAIFLTIGCHLAIDWVYALNGQRAI
jgi:hypothetical protein